MSETETKSAYDIERSRRCEGCRNNVPTMIGRVSGSRQHAMHPTDSFFTPCTAPTESQFIEELAGKIDAMSELVYVGEHHFPQMTYKKLCDDLWQRTTTAETQVEELAGRVQAFENDVQASTNTIIGLTMLLKAHLTDTQYEAVKSSIPAELAEDLRQRLAQSERLAGEMADALRALRT